MSSIKIPWRDKNRIGPFEDEDGIWVFTRFQGKWTVWLTKDEGKSWSLIPENEWSQGLREYLERE